MNALHHVRGWIGNLCWISATAFVVIAQPLYLFPLEQQLPIVLTLVLVGLFAKKPFLSESTRRGRMIGAIVDIVLLCATVAAGMYIATHYQAIISRQGAFTVGDLQAAMVMSIVVLEGVRRSVGWPLTIVMLVFIAYALLGRSMPGPLLHRGFSAPVVAEQLVLSYTGFFGIPLQIMLRYVIIFIVFGALLQAAGGADFLVRFARALAGRYTGGVGKVATLSSALVGSISGSAAGNVATTGSVTIPAMKRGGYQPHVAAAIEAVASTGGQIMPPVMGAASFLMADYLGIPYARVALAAMIPAILFFVAAGMAVDIYARSNGLTGASRKEIEPMRSVLHKGWLYLIPIGLIYTLLLVGYSPTFSALTGVGATIVLTVLKKVDMKTIYRSMSEASESSAILCVVAAGAGVVVAVMQLTGLGARLASLLVDLAMGHTFVLLILAMISSIILGMGMPTTVVYVLLASLVVPALTMMGVPAISAHFFIFYFGVLAAITPPVALASYAGASIAGSPPDRTGWTALKLALPSFVIPFFFVTNPALLLDGSIGVIIQSSVTAVVGVGLFSMAIMNYLNGRMAWWMRVLLGTAAILLINRNWTTDLLGIVSFLVVWFAQGRHAKRVGTPRAVEK